MESTPLLNEIRRQPEVLDELYQRRGELIQLVKPYLESKNSPSIYAFGCGDSRVSAETAEAAFRSWSKLDYKAVPALEFLAYQLSNLRQDDIVIPISMSGNVDRTVAGMRAAQARGARALALTNSSSGQLAQYADAVFYLNLNEPASFLSSTVSYSTTLLSLFLISLEFSAGEQLSVAEEGLKHTIHSAGQAVESSERVAREIAQTFYSSTRTYVLATGPNLGTATHGAMKFAELTRTLAIPQELEEFAHQQFWILQPDDLVIILAESGGPLDLVRHFVDTLSEYGTKIVVVTQAEETAKHASAAILLPADVSGYWSSLLMCIPLQFLAYYWSLAQGLNPNTRVHLREDERRFTTSRKLTRTALIGTGL